MQDIITVIQQVGFPIAAAIGLGWFIYKLIMRILVALIDRVRSLDNEIIRQDTLIKTILGVPQLIDSNKIAKADRDDQRKD